MTLKLIVLQGILLMSCPYYHSDPTLCNAEWSLKNTAYIRENAAEIIANTAKVDDNCIFVFLDTLTVRYIQYNDQEAIHTLSSIADIADGFVSEYYLEVVERLATKNFSRFTLFLSENQDDKLLEYLLELGQYKSINSNLIQLIDKELSSSDNSKGKEEFLHELKESLES